MPKEELVASQTFAAFPAYTVRTRDEALTELSRPCGQFRSPMSSEERARLFISGQLGKFDMLGNATYMLGPGSPLNWHVLLRYLHEKKIIEGPSFAHNYLQNDLPKFYALFLRTIRDEHKTDGRDASGNGYGHAQSAELAMAKAIGETLERYFLTLYRRDSLLRASSHDLMRRSISHLDISHLNGFLPWQESEGPRFKRNADSPIHWVEGETVTGKRAYLPAQLVYWSYDFDHDTEEPILSQPTTNAAGAHYTREKAILSGLLEHIQRDGFLIYWLNSLSPKRIDVSNIVNEDIARVLETVQRYGLTIHFLNTTSDIGVPSVTCVIIDDRTDTPILAVGGGTGFDLQETILHAAYETLVVLHRVEQREGFSLPADYKPFSDPTVGHTERLQVWRGKEMLERFSFFLNGAHETPEEFIGAARSMETTETRLAYVLSQLHNCGEGYEPYIYEVRHEVLKTLGYHVVQTIVPQLIPLYLNERMATLDSKRLREVPAKIGYTAAETLNPWPHPFP